MVTESYSDTSDNVESPVRPERINFPSSLLSFLPSCLLSESSKYCSQDWECKGEELCSEPYGGVSQMGRNS